MIFKVTKKKVWSNLKLDDKKCLSNILQGKENLDVFSTHCMDGLILKLTGLRFSISLLYEFNSLSKNKVLLQYNRKM